MASFAKLMRVGIRGDIYHQKAALQRFCAIVSYKVLTYLFILDFIAATINSIHSYLHKYSI